MSNYYPQGNPNQYRGRQDMYQNPNPNYNVMPGQNSYMHQQTTGGRYPNYPPSNQPHSQNYQNYLQDPNHPQMGGYYGQGSKESNKGT